MVKAAVLLATALAAGRGAGQTPASIVVESPTMTTGQAMPRDYSPNGRNVSPPLSWGGLPAGTRELDLQPGLTRARLLDAIDGQLIGQGSMVPTYSRQPAEAGASR